MCSSCYGLKKEVHLQQHSTRLGFNEGVLAGSGHCLEFGLGFSVLEFKVSGFFSAPFSTCPNWFKVAGLEFRVYGVGHLS